MPRTDRYRAIGGKQDPKPCPAAVPPHLRLATYQIRVERQPYQDVQVIPHHLIANGVPRTGRHTVAVDIHRN